MRMARILGLAFVAASTAGAALADFQVREVRTDAKGKQLGERTLIVSASRLRLDDGEAGFIVDVAKGKVLFATVCQQCHSVGGQGGQVGPVLNGAGAMGVESLLRNLLTPNAAMEPGYRVFRVELKDGDVLDGIRVSEDKDAIVLRRPNMNDTRIAQKEVRKASFTKSSMMPEGLIDALQPEQVSDLFAYLKTLR